LNKDGISTDFPKGRVAFFATSNIHKFMESRQILAKYKIAGAMLRISATEIQDDNLENIAKTSVIDAVNKSGLPLIVEDAGLFINSLKGFPGPYSSYVYRTLGTNGILQLMKNSKERDASFHSVVAYSSPKETIRCFHGEVKGTISLENHGTSGFGFDPIFTPSGNKQTFAEMTLPEKNQNSHRAKALTKFARWYTSPSKRRF
jgi:XTP/dITP diphosphohydrolase